MILRVMHDARVAIHAVLTGVLAAMAGILVLPVPTFGMAKSLGLMASLGSEDQWAMALWMVACVGMVGLATPNRVMRLVSVLTLATVHGGIAGLLVLANPGALGTAPFTGLAVLGYYLAWRRTVEFR